MRRGILGSTLRAFIILLPQKANGVNWSKAAFFGDIGITISSNAQIGFRKFINNNMTPHKTAGFALDYRFATLVADELIKL